MENFEVMLAKKYKGEDPTGCWMSEKLDGVRAVWDGTHLKSRNGNIFYAPDWFVSGLPRNTLLDGELYEGRGLFQQTVGKVRKKNEPDWTGIRFMIFDCIDKVTFEHRQNHIHGLDLPEHVQIVQQIRCTGERHLDGFMEEIVASGGEGVMLRRAGSMYESGRSSSLLKYKYNQTNEAVVIGYEEGKGRLADAVGALVCKVEEKIFKVGAGLSDELRCDPPPLNSIITFSFFELTNGGLPRFPVYVGRRDYE